MMESAIILPKILTALASALLIAAGVSIVIGSERKAAWFRRSYKQSFFQRRGMLGEIFRFGHPCTWQGVCVMLIMLSCVSLSVWIIFIKF